jgi:hypothetical protein
MVINTGTPPNRPWGFVAYSVFMAFYHLLSFRVVWNEYGRMFMNGPVSVAARYQYQYWYPLEHCDLRFESCSRHGCVSAFLCVCVVLCR